jgi:hypothetical protein
MFAPLNAKGILYVQFCCFLLQKAFFDKIWQAWKLKMVVSKFLLTDHKKPTK